MPSPKDLRKRKYMFSDDVKFLQKIVIFYPSEDKFLILKRSANAFSRPDCWDLPGGNVLFGELHDKSLKKEIKEETNLNATDIKLVQLITSYDKEKNIYYIFAGHTGIAVSNDVVISNEHSEYEWIIKEKFMTLESADFLINLVNEVFQYRNI